MIFARSVAIACLTVLKALFWFTAGLLLLLTIVQHLRGDIDARPMVTILSGLAFGAIGLAAHWGAKRFQNG